MKPSLGITLALAAACTSLAAQQMPGSPRLVVRPSGFPSGHRAFAHAHNGQFFYPVPFLDSFYPDYAAEPATQPPVIIVQPAPAQAPETSAHTPSQPLLIELRGDNYVSLSGASDSNAQTLAPETLAAKAQLSPIPNVVTASSPALLIFRDGHQEEVSSYTIAAGVIYASADYYSAGSWNRAIQISSLNVSQTIASNRSRGVPFHLPHSPNEVVVGP